MTLFRQEGGLRGFLLCLYFYKPVNRAFFTEQDSYLITIAYNLYFFGFGGMPLLCFLYPGYLSYITSAVYYLPFYVYVYVFSYITCIYGPDTDTWSYAFNMTIAPRFFESLAIRDVVHCCENCDSVPTSDRSSLFPKSSDAEIQCPLCICLSRNEHVGNQIVREHYGRQTALKAGKKGPRFLWISPVVGQ